MSAGRALLLLRHGRTAWNEHGRVQGRADVALSAHGRAALAGWTVPRPWRDGCWVSSPLSRARDTARALGAADPVDAPELIEMDWGEWQGCTLPALRARDPEGMRRNEARGLDFRPRGGESPREVRARVAAWVRGLDPGGPPLVAVTHKGVIRAALSLATGWDMVRDYPERMRWDCAQAFARDMSGRLVLVALNVALERAAQAAARGRREPR